MCIKDQCFSHLAELNYHMGVYEAELPLYDESSCRFENIKRILMSLNHYIRLQRWKSS